MTIFWHCQRVLLVESLARGTKIDGLYYGSAVHRLRHSIPKKYLRKLSRGVLLLHDKAPVHKFNIIPAAIYSVLRLHRIELNYPTYSPNSTSSDYHLFSDMKNVLSGRNFDTDDEAIMTVNHYLESLDRDYFLET